MSELDMWAAACAENGSELWQLEKCDNIELYAVRSGYEYKHHSYYNSPVYFVFVDEKEVLNTLNYQYAYKTWEKCKETEVNR